MDLKNSKMHHKMTNRYDVPFYGAGKNGISGIMVEYLSVRTVRLYLWHYWQFRHFRSLTLVG